jgi:hypothetical protein
MMLNLRQEIRKNRNKSMMLNLGPKRFVIKYDAESQSRTKEIRNKSMMLNLRPKRFVTIV